MSFNKLIPCIYLLTAKASRQFAFFNKNVQKASGGGGKREGKEKGNHYF